MNPYGLYMEKMALNATTRRMEFAATPVRNVSRSGSVTSGVQHQVRWKSDGQVLGDLDVEHRNTPGGIPMSVPKNTGSVDWINFHHRDAIRSGRGAVMRDLSNKTLGRAAWRAKQDGMTHMIGDAGGVYTGDGEKFTKTMKGMVGQHAPVSTIPSPLGHGDPTPMVNLDTFFKNKVQARMTDRQTQTGRPHQDSLATTQVGQRKFRTGYRG